MNVKSMMDSTNRAASSKSADELMQERIDKALYGATLRLNAIASDIARSRTTDVSSVIVERLEAVEHRMVELAEKPVDTTSIDELKTALATTQALVQRIADQPQSGGPSLRLADSANADKHVATDPEQSKEAMSNKEAIERASKLGLIDATKLSPYQQVNAAFNAIRAM